MKQFSVTHFLTHNWVLHPSNQMLPVECYFLSILRTNVTYNHITWQHVLKMISLYLVSLYLFYQAKDKTQYKSSKSVKYHLPPHTHTCAIHTIHAIDYRTFNSVSQSLLEIIVLNWFWYWISWLFAERICCCPNQIIVTNYRYTQVDHGVEVISGPINVTVIS